MAKKSGINFQQIMTDLRRKAYSPVYFLMGDEPYYIDQISDFIENKILDESEVDFNRTVLYGRDINIGTVIDSAKRYPMMSDYQVIVVKEAQQIKAWDDLLFYLKNPLKSTILCFCYKYGKPDGRKKWVQELNKTAVVFESVKLYENEMGGWISSYLSEKQMQIHPKAQAMLVEFLGTNLSKVANELDKLLLIKPAGEKQISPELIEKNIGISKDYNVFELESALIERDVLKANQIVHYFGQNPKEFASFNVLPSLFNYFSNLMIYHYLPNKSDAVVSSELGINPYFVKKFVAGAKSYNAWKTMIIISWIRETDARSKGIDDTGTDFAELLKELVYKTLH